MLQKELASKLSGRLMVVGVGDSGRGDDGVGPLVAQMLTHRGLEDVIDSGAVPELDTWRLRERRPDKVLFVDAVDFGGRPGEVTLLAAADLRQTGYDTHRMPLKLTMEYLEQDLGCKCYVLAIQPKDVRQGAPMCSEVKSSATNSAEILVEARRATAEDGRR